MDPARCKGSRTLSDPRIAAIPDVHGHAKGEHRPFADERPIAYSARMIFLWFYHAARRGSPRFLMICDHINYLTFEDPGAVHTVRRALKLAHAGDLYGAAETAGVDVAHAAVVSEGLRRGMRFSIGAEVDNDPRARPDAQNIVDAMRPDGIIRSVHFVTVDHPEKGADWPWAFDNPEFTAMFEIVGVERLWELYMAKLIEDIEKLPGHIVGNFYGPASLGHWPTAAVLEKYEDRLLAVCHARNLAVEINTRMLYRDGTDAHRKHVLAANKRLMRKAKTKGVGIAIGSAAHSPKDQGAAFDVVLQLLDDCGINEVVFPVAGRLARVVLRATREHLEAQRPVETVQPGSSISGFSRAELGLPEDYGLVVKKPARGSAAKKRTTGPTRTSKGPAPQASVAKSTSRRTPESAASSSKAKQATAAKPAVHKPAPKKPALKAAPVKKVSLKKLPAKKAPAKTTLIKKTSVKKTPVKSVPMKKVTLQKTPLKKQPAKKAPLRKVPAKSVPIRRATAKKVPAKKIPAKKAPAKKLPLKRVPVKKAAPQKPLHKPVAKAKKAPAKKKPAKRR